MNRNYCFEHFSCNSRSLEHFHRKPMNELEGLLEVAQELCEKETAPTQLRRDENEAIHFLLLPPHADCILSSKRK